MGRQIGIIAVQKDVDDLIDFLRETSDIAIFRGFAQSVEELWTDRPILPSDGTFHIWNKQFAWKPEYRRVGEKAYHPEMAGAYYVGNTSDAPIVEIDVGNVSDDRRGRVYWAKDFAAPRGLSYDVAGFTEWFDKIIAWIKRKGRKSVSEWMSPYYLPGAWKVSQSVDAKRVSMKNPPGKGPAR